MPNSEWSEAAAEASERDPRDYPYGYLTGGSFALDTSRVFVWFGSLAEMLQHLESDEPRVYDLEPGAGLEEYQDRVRPVLRRVREEGPSDALLRELEVAIDDAFAVEWWGTYADLREGRGPFGRELVHEFLGEEREGERLKAEDEDEFVEYLKTCRV